MPIALTLPKRRQLFLLVQFLLKSWVPCAAPLASFLSLDYLGWQLPNQPFLVYIFSSFYPSLPCFPHSVYNSCAYSRAFSPLLRPLHSVLVPVPVPILVPVPISATALFSVPALVPLPILFLSTGLYPPSPFPSPSRSRPVRTVLLPTGYLWFVRYGSSRGRNEFRCMYALAALPKRMTPLIEPSSGQDSPVLACLETLSRPFVNSTMACEHACGSTTGYARGGSLWHKAIIKSACSRPSCLTSSTPRRL